MKRTVPTLLALALLLLSGPGDAPASFLAQSTFDTDLDGWTTILLTAGTPPSNITFAPASGNPGGAARHDPPSEGFTSYFLAPPKFPAAFHLAVGGSISWDISTINHTDDVTFGSSDLTISTGTTRIRQFVTPPNPIFPTYAHYDVDFTTGEGWFFTDGINPQTPATQAEIDAVLLGATLMVIRAEYWSGPSPDVAFLDNVIVRGVPGPAPLALLGLGIGAALLFARRRGARR